LSNTLAVSIGLSHCILQVSPRPSLGSSGAGPAQAAATSTGGEDVWSLPSGHLEDCSACCREYLWAQLGTNTAFQIHQGITPSCHHCVPVCHMVPVDPLCQSPSCHQDAESSWHTPQGLETPNIHHQETIPS